MDFKQFAKAMEQRAFNVISNANEIKKDAALQLVKTAAETTPVDTGEAISGWIVGINEARPDKVKPHAPGLMGSTHSENIRATVAAAQVVLDTVLPGDAVHVTNNASHIQDLEDGKSPQNSNMTGQAIAAAKSLIKGRTLLGRPNGRPT